MTDIIDIIGMVAVLLAMYFGFFRGLKFGYSKGKNLSKKDESKPKPTKTS
jgi:hypothetical protein